MDAGTLTALPGILDGQHLVETFGLVGISLVVFAETGLLLGFFLPGDSLLFAAGYASTGKLAPGLHPDVATVCLAISFMAIVGAQTGFAIGRKAGPTLFQREDSRLFKRSYVTKAEEVVRPLRRGQGDHPGPVHPDRAHVPQPASWASGSHASARVPLERHRRRCSGAPA